MPPRGPADVRAPVASTRPPTTSCSSCSTARSPARPARCCSWPPCSGSCSTSPSTRWPASTRASADGHVPPWRSGAGLRVASCREHAGRDRRADRHPLDADQRGRTAAWRSPPACGRPRPTCRDTPRRPGGAGAERRPEPARRHRTPSTSATASSTRRRARPSCLPCRPADGSAAPDVDAGAAAPSWRESASTCTRSTSGPIDDEVRWLEACLWPEQTQRLQRFRAAVERGPSRSAPARCRATCSTTCPHSSTASRPAPMRSSSTRGCSPTWPVLAAVNSTTSSREACRARPVSWFSAEAPGVVASLGAPVVEDGGLTALGLVTGRSGEPANGGSSAPATRTSAWIDWSPLSRARGSNTCSRRAARISGHGRAPNNPDSPWQGRR